MELHPDRNPSPNATREFQHVNEAYNVLSDPASRAEYDTLSFEATTHTAGPAETETPPEPIVCSSCGKVTAQPRYAIFYEVKSFVFVTTRSPIQGIFCHACGEKKALRATAVTWLLGWWGFPWGPIFSVQAIFQNLVGGVRPNDVNARLLAYQAWVFIRQGEIELARAVAADALELAQKIKPEKISLRLRKALGYNIEDEGAKLRTEINAFLSATDTGASIRRLKNVWSLFARPFYVQGGIFLAVFAAIWGAVVLESPKQSPSYPLETTATRTPAPVPKQAFRPPPKPAYVRPPLAGNGSPWPTTSGYVRGYPSKFMNGYSTVTIDNSQNDSDVFVKLFSRDIVKPTPIRVFFIKAHDKFTVLNVRPGNYDVRYRDLDSGAKARADPFNLEEIPTDNGVRFTELTLTLYKVRGGNVRMHEISDAEFE